MCELLTDDLRSVLPKLRDQDGAKDPIVYAIFYFPGSNWLWYVTEGEPEGGDFRFFGYVVGFEAEWGYFTLGELEEVNINGLKIMRVDNFQPKLMSDIPPF